LRRISHILGWFVLIQIAIIAFGVTSAPLLLVLIADTAAAVLLVRSCIEPRSALPAGALGARHAAYGNGGR
jgi:hypothetical protein